MSQAWFTHREVLEIFTFQTFYMLLDNSRISLAWFLDVRHVSVMRGISLISQARLHGRGIRPHTTSDKAKQKVRQA